MEKNFDLKVGARIAELDIANLLDADRLVRLHPHWFVESRQEDDGWVRFHLRDYATEQEFDLVLRTGAEPAPQDPPASVPVLRITLQQYPVQEMLFYVQNSKAQVRLRGRDGLMAEQEQDVLLWARAIQEYLRLYAVTTPHTLFFRAIMNHMMLKMNPSQRKITIMLTKITVIEILVTVIIVVGYVYFN